MFRFLIVIYSILLLPYQVLANEPELPGGYSFGYWNDNFIYEKLIDGIIKPGKDDFQTANFWLNTGLTYNCRILIVDAYLNIMTNRSENYRADMLSFRISIIKRIGAKIPQSYPDYGTLRYGGGLTALGNFGGEKIQNTYHQVRGIKQVRIPYKEGSRIGLIGYMDYSYLLYAHRLMSLTFSASNSLRVGVSPSTARTGLEYSLNSVPLSDNSNFSALSRVEIIYNYLKSEDVSPLFSSGVAWGVMIGLARTKLSAHTWMTYNQYGLHQPHFGVSFGWNSRTTLSCVMYP